MNPNSYQPIVEKCVAHMQGHLAEEISIPAIAKAIGYSHTHIRRAFQLVTGQSAKRYLTQLRLRKAAQMLSQTTLPTIDIAFECGFGSYVRFAVAFREHYGMSASRYRAQTKTVGVTLVPQQQALAEMQPREVFRDSFEGSFLSDWWKVREGQWAQRDGMAIGKSQALCTLDLQYQLPENFRVEFDVRFATDSGYTASDLLVILNNDQGQTEYCAFNAGRDGNTHGNVSRSGMIQQWNQDATVKPDVWQHVLLELNDNEIRLAMDQKELFSFVDPFPPPYTKRCRLAVGSWQSAVCFRNLVIYDLGFSPAAPVVRRGDSLYNASLFPAARDFYMRMLAATTSEGEAQELRHKIGMCFLQEGLHTQSREWLEKVSGGDKGSLWHRLSWIALRENDVAENELDTFCAEARTHWADPLLQSAIREAINRAAMDLGSRGFVFQRRNLAGLLLEMEQSGTTLHALAQHAYAGACASTQDYAAAVSHLQHMAGQPSLPSAIKYRQLFNQFDSQTAIGRLAEAAKVLHAARALASNQYQKAHCEAFEGILLRAQGRMQDALAKWESLKEQFPSAITWWNFGRLESALILCGLDHVAEARGILDESAGRTPDLPLRQAENFHVPHFVKREYAASAEILMQGSRLQGIGAISRSLLLIKAGISCALAGQTNRAAKAWKETTRRYPIDRFAFVGPFAESLLAGNNKGIHEMPGDIRQRSEMFYMVAVLREKEGDLGHARELFDMAMKEDPTNRWPAYLAKRKLLA